MDTSDFEALREAMSALQQEHERLIGTAAHLSHELDVSKEHVKVGEMGGGGGIM